MELRFTQRHVVALNFLLIAGVVYFAVRCVDDFVLRRMSVDKAPVATAAAPKSFTGVRTRAYYDTVVKRDVFNLVPQEASGPAPVVVEDLHLKLLGTSLISKSKPYAIVEDQNGGQSLYQVGEDIPDAGRLVSVERTRAIIDRNGQRVAIEIPSSAISEVAPSRLGGPSAPVGPITFPRGIPAMMNHRTGRHRPAGDDEESKIQLKKLGPGKFEASRSEVANTMQNPAQLFSQMRALPHIVDGKTDGFSISNVAPGSVFEQLGLQEGDMLTEINGAPVTNPMQAMGLMQSVQTASSIDLTILRGGSPTKVHLDLR